MMPIPYRGVPRDHVDKLLAIAQSQYLVWVKLVYTGIFCLVLALDRIIGMV